MSKTYDRVEWDFLEVVMKMMGFEHRLLRLIMVCIQTVSFSILIDGKPTGRITPSRGPR